VDLVRVKLMTSPRLLTDLLAAALTHPELDRWEPGKPPALVSITNVEPGNETDSRVTIVLGDRLDDPISVIVDGERTSRPPTRPSDLHDLVLQLAHEIPQQPLPKDPAAG
jgi:hypothetical protein